MNEEHPKMIEKRRKWDLRFIELAKLVSTWSKDPSTQTGAVIVAPSNEVVSVGFNGFPQSMFDDTRLYTNREEKYSRIVHCEVNALLFARRNVSGHTLVTYPFLSCDRCCVQMLQAGITRFVAPRATDEQLERWGPAFERTRKYITESGATYLEIDLNG
jgi:dCMP deaminase